MISNHEGRSVRRKWSFIRRRTDARNAGTPTLLVRSAMEAVPAAAAAPCRHCAASSLPPRLCRHRRPPSTKHQIRSRRENGGLVDRPNRAPLSSSLPSLPFHPGLPAYLCFRRLLGPNSSHFEENILQRKFKSFCRRPLNQGVSRSFNKLRNYSKKTNHKLCKLLI